MTRMGDPLSFKVTSCNEFFPSFQPEQKPDENRIVSIYRTRVDDCGRLWFVCTGALEQSN